MLSPAVRPDALPARVLLVRLGAIGDVVNALLVAGAIRAARPDVHVGWAVHDLARPLVEDNPAVDRVHVWSRGGGFAGWRRLVRELRGERYDLAVDLQRIAKSAVLARRSGAPRVLGFDRARSKEGAWLWATERTRPGLQGMHVVEQYRDVLRALGLPDALPVHPLPHDAAAEAWADGERAALGAPPLLVNLGASKPENRWPPQAFVAFAHALAGERPIVLTGGPADRATYEATLADTARTSGVVDRVGRTSLRQLAALARRAFAMVSADTGPMHLAAAVGCPVVALFGPADPARTGPYGRGHVILRAPARDGAEPRMHDLEPATVVTAVRALLRG